MLRWFSDTFGSNNSIKASRIPNCSYESKTLLRRNGYAIFNQLPTELQLIILSYYSGISECIQCIQDVPSINRDDNSIKYKLLGFPGSQKPLLTPIPLCYLRTTSIWFVSDREHHIVVENGLAEGSSKTLIEVINALSTKERLEMIKQDFRRILTNDFEDSFNLNNLTKPYSSSTARSDNRWRIWYILEAGVWNQQLIHTTPYSEFYQFLHSPPFASLLCRNSLGNIYYGRVSNNTIFSRNIHGLTQLTLQVIQILQCPTKSTTLTINGKRISDIYEGQVIILDDSYEYQWSVLNPNQSSRKSQSNVFNPSIYLPNTTATTIEELLNLSPMKDTSENYLEYLVIDIWHPDLLSFADHSNDIAKLLDYQPDVPFSWYDWYSTSIYRRKPHDHDLLVKTVLLGGPQTGKTTFLQNFHRVCEPENIDQLQEIDYQYFPERYIPTIGVDFFVSKTKNICGYDLRIQYWDTAGGVMFGSLRSTYLTGGLLFLVFIDRGAADLIEQIYRWYHMVIEKIDHPLILLLFTKCDLYRQSAPEYFVSLTTISATIHQINERRSQSEYHDSPMIGYYELYGSPRSPLSQSMENIHPGTPLVEVQKMIRYTMKKVFLKHFVHSAAVQLW